VLLLYQYLIPVRCLIPVSHTVVLILNHYLTRVVFFDVFFAARGDVQGDVTDAASVTAAMAGCCKCVACFGAQRLTKLSDLWMDSTQDPAHPYQINYMGVANLVEAAKATPGFQKMVRVTGLSVGYSAFDKIAVLLNLVLSLTIRYQTMGERVIRDSGIDYTIIRPGNMKEPRPEGAQLRLSAGTGVRNHPVGKVLRQVRSIRSQPWPVANTHAPHSQRAVPRTTTTIRELWRAHSECCGERRVLCCCSHP
jgi:nucleoside-diphosphate-sugar epimerase